MFFVNYIWEADSPVQLIKKFVMKTCLENQHKKLTITFPDQNFIEGQFSVTDFRDEGSGPDSG